MVSDLALIASILTEDCQGKTRNFAHPALREVAIAFFYTGPYQIAQRMPEIFRTELPLSCLALVAAVVSYLLHKCCINFCSILVQLRPRRSCEKRTWKIIPEFFKQGLQPYLQSDARISQRYPWRCVSWSEAVSSTARMGCSGMARISTLSENFYTNFICTGTRHWISKELLRRSTTTWKFFSTSFLFPRPSFIVLGTVVSLCSQSWSNTVQHSHVIEYIGFVLFLVSCKQYSEQYQYSKQYLRSSGALWVSVHT